MYKQALMGDAWIREAQEVGNLVEDIEARSVNNNKNKNPIPKHHQQQNRLLLDVAAARSKLFEAGIKLDRLESLLRNPPSKPILTNEDLDYRWKLVSDMRRRTKALALSLYALPTTSSRPGPENTKETNITANDYEKDQTKTLSAKEDSELFLPLMSNDGTMQSQEQIKRCGSSTTLSLLQKVFWFFGAVLGSAALIFILFVICAVI